ncbi:MAG TPA: phosphoglucomutase [Ignavibacteriales bacterium]|nr:phosphoglucomutase [Ignavibacteriales bacterium]HOL81271.1 phosphoglucomutase [Ignavibacteriales bacterium]HOM66210.1 phosphoglucomutase [Ignavibacteriales bacterium]HPD68529.1 phosphoglucomutase [Ignavibacteriales bacterium]HPP33382.1 phosphoglucomutase [Ignavibacteriales bacterium]
MEIKFGTDGWRAIIGDEITPNSIAKVAHSFSKYLLQRYNSKKNILIVIGYDGRKFSDEFAEIFAKITSSYNIISYLSDKITPTPFVSGAIKQLSLDAGVMITASHNPPSYNGIKFKDYYGGPFFTEETLKVEKLLSNEESIPTECNYKKIDLFDVYLKLIKEKINFDIIKNANLSILVDSMYGAGQDYIKKILEINSIDSTVIYNKPLSDFNGRLPERIEKNLLELSNELKKGNFSLCLATDGDADRLGVMLENGEWLSAQEQILYLMDYVVNRLNFQGDLVVSSSVTGKIEKYLGNDLRRVIRVPVGFKYIFEEFVKGNVAVGCEESGGYGFGFHIPERDGIFSSLMFIQMLADSGYTKLSDFVNAKRKEFDVIYYDRIDHHFEGDSLKILHSIYNSQLKNVMDKNITNISTYTNSRGIINGIKFIFDSPTQWVLIRCSETEPLVRIYAEGNSLDEVNELLTYFQKYF